MSPAEVNQIIETSGPGGTVYLIGAGGSGMSGLGHLLIDLGHRVAGSDQVFGQEVRQLSARGAAIHVGHSADHLIDSHPVLAVYSSAIHRDNPEIKAAEENRIPLARRATLLAALMLRQRGIAIAGMHGKTTTTALLAFALNQLGACPSFAVGGLCPQLERPARFSLPSPASAERRPIDVWFVAEADESDGTLSLYQPEHLLLLNLDADHLDHFASLEAIRGEFERCARQARGLVAFCADDAALAEIGSRLANSVSFGFHPLADYRIELIAGPRLAGGPPAGGTRFRVWHRGASLAEFELGLMGEHNAGNAVGVIALLHQIGFGPEAIARSLAPFRGVQRRQELLFADDRFQVYDDYGHHPAEIRVTLAAFRALQRRRLLVAFQPHRFTRTQRLLVEFADALCGVDRLWLMEIYAASEVPIPGVTSEALAAAIRARGHTVECVPEIGSICQAVRAALEPGDVALFVGAGADITAAAHQLATELRAESFAPAGDFHTILASRLASSSAIRRDEPLAKRTTMRVGGRADWYVEPAGEEDLATVLRLCREFRMPFLILGRGSNLLIRDGGIRGVVICLAKPQFSRIEIAGDRLVAGAGARLKAVATEARRHGLAGLEFLEGIPGSVGGALRMNAGAMGSWTFESVESVRFMDHAGQVRELPSGEVGYEYRGCPMFKTHIALGAVFKGVPSPPETVTRRMESFNARRWETQPKESSAGCIFKNPATIPAGRLIEELGLKGCRVGRARVSEVHGNFIVNDGGATADNVLELIERIRMAARQKRGIELETEVEILGEQR